MRRIRCLGILALVSLTVSTADASDHSLTPEQAVCEELQMERLQRRFTGNQGLYNSILLWPAEGAVGRFEGLFAPQGIDLAPFVRDEQQLSFELLFKEDGFLLNPARLPLVETTILRRDQESTVLPATTPDQPPWNVSFEVAGGEFDPIEARLPVRVSMLEPSRSATRVGRGPAEDDLLTACGPSPSATDVKIFRILARTVRPTCWATGCSDFPVRYKMAVFRAPEAWTYRADLYSYGLFCEDDERPETCGYTEISRIALRFRFQVAAGRLQTGVLEVLPECSPGQVTGCTRPFIFPEVGIFVLPPIWAGQVTQGPAELARGVHLELLDREDPTTYFANLDWADLLRDTTWNSGFE
jgi:hypothetical protein